MNNVDLQTKKKNVQKHTKVIGNGKVSPIRKQADRGSEEFRNRVL